MEKLTSATSDTTLTGLARLLEEEAHDLSEEAMNRVFAEVPEYANIAPDDLRLSALTNTRRGVDCLTHRKIRNPDDATEPQRITRKRISQGLAIESIIRAYRLTLTVVHDRFVQLAMDSDLKTRDTLLGSTLLWRLGDWFIDRAVRAYRTSAVTEEVRRQIEKVELLRALRAGTQDAETWRLRAVGLGLSPVAAYRVLITSTEAKPRWVELVEKSCSLPQARAVAADLGDVAVALVAEKTPGVRESLAEHPVAAGPARMLADARESCRSAEAAFQAMPPDVAGWWDVGALSWRIAVRGSAAMAELVAAKYTDPLEEEGEFGEVLMESVSVFIDHRRVLRKAAAELFVHENTLRHRLQRFEQVTGSRLSEADTLIEVSWLRHLRVLGLA